MKLEDLHTEAAIDAKIDQSDLATASIKRTEKTMKWLKYHSLESIEAKNLEKKLKVLYKNKWLYFNGKAPDEEYVRKPLDIKVLKCDVDMFIDADSEMIQGRLAVDIQQQKVAFIDQFIKNLNTQSFDIGHAIDFLKFKNGLG